MKTRLLSASLLTIGLGAFSALPLACGGSDSPSNEDEDLDGDKNAPQPLTETRECIISADCDVGSHCDLGECIQECNAKDACNNGKSCSARARCLGEDEDDVDPPVVTKKIAELSVDPIAVVLTEDDDNLRLTLTSSNKEPVRYRIVSNAAYLSIAEPRGEFSEDTVVELKVDRTKIQGRTSPGTVRIITNLGELTVDAPVQLGLTGSYEGVLRYFAGDVPLGQTRIQLDLEEKNGDVQVRVDPEKSLLFPSEDGSPTFGTGLFTESEGLEFTVRHLLSETAGGARNHFKREIGRELTVGLNPTEQGRLEGEFEEKIHGLFEQAVTVTGTISLRARPIHEEMVFEAPAKVTMPKPPAEVFTAGAFYANAGLALRAAPAPACDVISTSVLCLMQADDAYFEGLEISFSRTRSTSDPIGDIRADCEEEAALTYTEFFAQTASNRGCAHPAGPAAVLGRLIAYQNPGAEPDENAEMTPGALFHRSLARMLAPAMLIAQDDIVQGVRDSFLNGISAHKAKLENAQAALEKVATVALQPAVLEFVRRTPIEYAAGDETSDDATAKDYPGFRGLSRLLFVKSVIDGELSAIAATDATESQAARLLATQERAVLTLVEAAALTAIVDEWEQYLPALAHRSREP